MARWIEAQSPVGTLRLINIDVAAKVDFVFLESSSVPFLAQVHPSTGPEFDEVIEPAVEQLYAYLSQGDALVPGVARAYVRRASPVVPTTLSDRLQSETSVDAGGARPIVTEQA